MSAAIYAPRSHTPVTASDRLGMTLFFAVVVHAALILGISLSGLDVKPLRTALPTIEITLVTTSSPLTPKKPDYLAQANQEGGSPSEAPEIITSPPPASTPLPEPEPVIAMTPAPTPLPQELVAQLPAAPEPIPEAAPVETPASEPEIEVMTQVKPSKAKPVAPVKPKAKARAAPPPPAATRATPSAADLINRSMQIASLSAQVAESTKAYAKRPRMKAISASTQEFKYASYMEAWRTKVERIGNLNYPDEAKRLNLSGNLRLDVALNADGSINKIDLTLSSGHKVLDDAAIAIVKLAAPYGPFPDDIKKDIDILHIVRTWQFLPNNRLSSK